MRFAYGNPTARNVLASLIATATLLGVAASGTAAEDLPSYLAPQDKKAGTATKRLSARTVFQRIFQSAPGAPPDLHDADLSRLDLAELDFKSAELSGANFYGTDLSKARLAGASLQGADLDRATITATDFSGADLTDARIVRPTVFTTLEVASSEAPKFTAAKLIRFRSDGHFDRADFSDADLTGAILGRTAVREAAINAPPSFESANFTRAVLRDATLSRTSLKYARFVDADLRGADLSGCDLLLADFSGADLTGANLTGADLDEANLRTARGLDKVIGLDTVLNLDTARRAALP